MADKDKASSGRRKLAAIMFADMVSFSAITQRDEALALSLVDEHRALMKPILEEFAGRMVKTMGDGYMVEFASALEAAQCAAAIQRAMATRNAAAKPERQMSLRIGIHLGDVVEREADVFGDGVNIAARIEPKAEPGGVCVSQQVFDQIHNKIKDPLLPMGRVELKNIVEPLAVYKLSIDGTAAAPLKAEAPKKSQNAVAVLPFVNMSSDQENEYLSDGITEDIISSLSSVEGLRVSARTSAFAFKGKKEDVRKIGESLSVSWVVEGSVRKSGTKLRVTAQLVGVKDGYQLWTERFDREMRDVFAIQDEITTAIVTALKAKFNVACKLTSVGPRALTTTEAYELYLKGRSYWSQRGSGLKKARHYFELAVLEDPRYAPPYAGLADTFSLMAFYGMRRPGELALRIRQTAGRALELDANLPDGHSPLGFISLMYDHDARDAFKHLNRALELSVNYAPAHYWSAVVFGALERHDEAWESSRRAMELDPLSPIVIAISGWLRIFARRFEEAEVLLRRAVEISPNFMLPHWIIGQALVGRGDLKGAVSEFETAVALSNRSPWWLGTLGWALALSGRKDEAALLRRELEGRRNSEYVPALMLTRLCLGLGDAAGARQWLETAVEEHDSLLVWLNADFAFDALKTPENADLIGRLRPRL
ncbi:MAG: adenylate/guanylate cyclase domain-containing protein [Elusimicrobia bacterium]|nr:adenylate/guanylate cyclase domain-containing protein [Elusimicrobiota bacterium]